MTTIRTFVLTIAAGLALSVAPARASGESQHFFTVEIYEGRIAYATAPVPLGPDQTVLAMVWTNGAQATPIQVSAVDAMTGETLGAASAEAVPGVVSVMALPAKRPSARYVMFKADGNPLRAKVHVGFRVFDGPLTADSLTQAWGRTFEPGPVSKRTSFRTEPLILTDSHQLELQLFNRGGRAAVTVRGWDYATKQVVEGTTEIVEGSKGARIEIPSQIAYQLTPLIPGGEANGLIQLELIVEPLDGPADIVATATAQSGTKYDNITLKRGVID